MFTVQYPQCRVLGLPLKPRIPRIARIRDALFAASTLIYIDERNVVDEEGWVVGGRRLGSRLRL